MIRMLISYAASYHIHPTTHYCNFEVAYKTNNVIYRYNSPAYPTSPCSSTNSTPSSPPR
jgi:hypothetical protein